MKGSEMTRTIIDKSLPPVPTGPSIEQMITIEQLLLMD